MLRDRLTKLVTAYGPCVATATIALHSAGGRRVDAQSLEGLRALPPTWSEQAGRAIVATDPFVAAALVAAIAWTALRWHTKRDVPPPMLPALFIALGVISFAKGAIDRPGRDDVLLAGNSLPSGHVAAAVLLGILVVTFVPRRSLIAGSVATAVVAAGALLVVVSTGHRPSDVIVAFMAMEATVAVSQNVRMSPFTYAVAVGWAAASIAPVSGPTAQAAGAVFTVGLTLALSISVIHRAEVGVRQHRARRADALASDMAVDVGATSTSVPKMSPARV